MFRVRKATALNLDKICKVVGEAGITRLLPAYVRLTKDDVYRVRLFLLPDWRESDMFVPREVFVVLLYAVFCVLYYWHTRVVQAFADAGDFALLC